MYYILNDKNFHTDFSSIDLETIDKEIEKDPKNGLLYYQKAVYMLKLKNYNKVFQLCSKAIDIGFPVFDCYILMSVASYETNNYSLQRDYATLAIERDPTSHEGYLMRARAYYHLNEYRKAINDFYIAYNMTKDDNILYEIAIVYKKMNKYINSLDILRNLYKKYSKNSYILILLVDTYKELKFYNNSIYLLDNACSNKLIGRVECLEKKVEILYEMGDYEYALVEFNEILKIDKNYDKNIYCKLLIKNGFNYKKDMCYYSNLKYLKISDSWIKWVSKVKHPQKFISPFICEIW